MGTDRKKPLGIYVHIPFCVRKCKYCDFVSFPMGGAGDASTVSPYVDAIIKEINGYRDKFRCADTEYEVKTVYIGGGTPSVIAPFYIAGILECVRETFTIDENAEITIEVNPGTVDPDKLKTYREAGINRISIGLQSVSDPGLTSIVISAFSSIVKVSLTHSSIPAI
jgi:oxygen-independent coproporphyrinogen-3 oxidase